MTGFLTRVREADTSDDDAVSGSPIPSIGDEYWVYSVNPIDNWTGWASFSSYDLPYQFIQALKEAAALADWEGDVRAKPGWRVAPVPCPDECDSVAIFAFKQDNNGTTFVFSPVKMPHLGEPKARVLNKPIVERVERPEGFRTRRRG